MAKSFGRSVVTLPETAQPYPSLISFLETRFPYMSPKIWRERISAGKVELENGDAVSPDMEYLPGIRLFYYREVAEEPMVPFQEKIIFHNEHLLVACKPHFLPVVPSGPYVQECLINRLKALTGNMALSPVHRIDRETAGIVLISTNPETRGAYQKMFMEEGKVRKTYSAVTSFNESGAQTQWNVKNRLETGAPWFRMQEVPGEINARTAIRLKRVQGNRGFFELHPITGKKHQLRLHLSNLGFPIINDRFYPRLLEKQDDDFAAPLQLLARKISFDDPVSGLPMTFESSRQLLFAGQDLSS